MKSPIVAYEVEATFHNPGAIRAISADDPETSPEELSRLCSKPLSAKAVVVLPDTKDLNAVAAIAADYLLPSYAYDADGDTLGQAVVRANFQIVSLKKLESPVVLSADVPEKAFSQGTRLIKQGAGTEQPEPNSDPSQVWKDRSPEHLERIRETFAPKKR